MISSCCFKVPHSLGTMTRKVLFEPMEVAIVVGSVHLDLTMDVRSHDNSASDWV